jgi:hypothetical protein
MLLGCNRFDMRSSEVMGHCVVAMRKSCRPPVERTVGRMAEGVGDLLSPDRRTSTSGTFGDRLRLNVLFGSGIEVERVDHRFGQGGFLVVEQETHPETEGAMIDGEDAVQVDHRVVIQAVGRPDRNLRRQTNSIPIRDSIVW